MTNPLPIDPRAEHVQQYLEKAARQLNAASITPGGIWNAVAVEAIGDYVVVRQRVAESSTKREASPNNLLDATEEFMRLGGQLGTAGRSDMWPVNMPEGLRKLRRKLLSEEYEEYIDGEDTDDIVEIVDGLLDVIVIAWGTLLAYIGPEKAKAAAAEVVRSNLSKVDGSLGPVAFRDDGKIVKPQGWTPPDISGAIHD